MPVKIKIDGVDFEVEQSAAQAVGKLQSRLDEADGKIAEAQAATEKERARADKAEEDLAAEKKAREDAEDPKVIRDAIDARLKLEREAAQILGDEVKLDELSETEIKTAVVVKAAKDPDAAKKRLDGCEPTYLAARYDAVIDDFEPATENNAGLAGVIQAANGAARSDGATESDAARQKMIERNRELGRKEIA